jgi:hypothetical protein
VGHIIQGKPGDTVVVDHTVQGVGTGAVVSDHAQVRGIRFRHSMGGHAVHSWQEIASEGEREAIFMYLDIALFANKRGFVRIGRGGPRTVECHWIAVLKSICPRPKTF